MKVNIKKNEKVYDGFFSLEKATLQFEKFDGTLSKEVVRENFYRGDSVAALIYDTAYKLVLLVRQFRYPVYSVEPDEARFLELVAGTCKPDEDPVNTLLREMREEVHIDAGSENVNHLYSFFVSPGGTSERIFLYAVETDLSSYAFGSGGLDEEHEDIDIVLLSFRDIFLDFSAGRIKDAKTIIALQWLREKIMQL